MRAKRPTKPREPRNIRFRLMALNLWSSKMGEDMKQRKREYMQAHGSEFSKMRKKVQIARKESDAHEPLTV